MEVTRIHVGSTTAVDAIVRPKKQQQRPQNKQTTTAEPAKLAVARAAWHRKGSNTGAATAAAKAATTSFQGSVTLHATTIATVIATAVHVLFAFVVLVSPTVEAHNAAGEPRTSSITPELLRAERVEAGLNGSECMDFCSDVVNATMCECHSREECSQTGDCCADRYIGAVPRPRIACVPAVSYRELMAVVRCPETWTPADERDNETRARCESANPRRFNLTYLDDLPVLSRLTWTLYRNVYCASCNGDTRDLRRWTLVVQCTPNEVSETKVARRSASTGGASGKQGRLALYVKLAVVFGITWVFGFAAALTGVQALWYPFIVLCSLQGAFIFLAFTFERSVLRMVRDRLCGSEFDRRHRRRSTSTTLTALHSTPSASSSALASVATGRAMPAQTANPEGVQKPLLRHT